MSEASAKKRCYVALFIALTFLSSGTMAQEITLGEWNAQKVAPKIDAAEYIHNAYRSYCVGVGDSIAYFATRADENTDGRGIHFGGLGELTQAAERWIKHCAPYIRAERDFVGKLRWSWEGDLEEGQ